MLDLILSRRADHRLRRATAALETFGARCGAGLLIAPTHRAANDFLRAATRSLDTSLWGWRPYTPWQLAHELAGPALAERGWSPLPVLSSRALAVRALAQLQEEGALRELSSMVDLPGFPLALDRTFGELRLADAKAEALGTLDGPAGQDLAALYARYLVLLDASDMTDRAGILHLAIAALAAAAKGQAGAGALSTGDLAHCPLIWLDAAPNGRLERQLLAALVIGRRAALSALPPYGSQREVLTSLGLDEFDPLGLTGEGSSDASGVPPESRLQRVQDDVFVPLSSAVASEEASAPDDTLVFFSAPGEGAECVEIVRRVQQLAAAGTPFDRMAILLRQPGAYRPHLEDAFRRAQLPAYWSRGTRRPDPAGRALLALLACASEGLTATRFAEYLSLGQVPQLEDGRPEEAPKVPFVAPVSEQLVLFADSEDEAPVAGGEALEHLDEELLAEELAADSPARAGTLVAPLFWEKALVDASVVGGSDRWRRRLTGRAAELERRARLVEEENELRAAALRRERQRLLDLARFALPLIGRLEGLPEGGSWGEWLSALEDLAVAALRFPRSVLALLKDLAPMSEVRPVSLEQVRQTLGDRLTELRAEPPRRRFGRLYVGSIEDAAARSFETVFLPGLAEGVFPRRALEDPLLLDQQRRRLEEDGIRLELQEDRIQAERQLLHLAVGAAEQQLVVSYPRVDAAEGRERVPSFYALDLLRAADGLLPKLDALARDAAEASARGAGWPAPEDPRSAIDEVEYDLALLRPLLRPLARGEDRAARREQTRGAGRFLLSSNRWLARSLRARAGRWRRGWFPSDGLVEPGAAAAVVLAGHRLSERSVSPTALQHFAACPYRFFLQAIQRLRPRDEIETLEAVDPLTRGSLFHDVQFKLFRELEASELLPVRTDNLDEVMARVDAVLDETAAEYEETLHPAIPRVWRTEVESLRSDLHGFVRYWEGEDWRWQPAYAELAFGLGPLEPGADGRDPASQPEPVKLASGVNVRGSIDLVERQAGGQRFRVTDYKTGRVTRVQARGRWVPIRSGDLRVAGGRVLQPVVYGLAAEAMLARTAGDEAPRQVDSGRLFYCTQRGGYEVVEVPLDERARSSFEKVTATVDDAIAEGFLPAAPDEGACRWCDYRPVCGPYEETRIAKKRRDELLPLVELRRLR